MSKLDCVSFEERIIYGDKEISLPPEILTWLSLNATGTVNIYISSHEVASGAANEAILVDEDSNTKVTFLWDTAGVGSDSLTVKTNGATDARAVKPIRAISGRLTSLTVSNGGSSAVDLGIARIVISDTTNTTLIKERI